MARIGIIGMGALGLLYADLIAAKYGINEVCFIMDEERIRKYHDQVFDCNGRKRQFQMVSVKEAQPVEFLMIAVKYNGLFDALDLMQNAIDDNTVILSVMNGIDSEEIIGARYGFSRLIYTIAQGMDAMKFGNTLSYTKIGEIRMGIRETEQQNNLERFAKYLDSIPIQYVIEQDIQHRLWCKFMMNVGINQACHAYETNFGGALTPNTEVNQMMERAMREVIILAEKEGVNLTEEDYKTNISILQGLLPEGMPSMRQDGVNKRHSEVEMFAGTVLRLGEKHGLNFPANQYLYDKIHAIESAY